MGGQKRLLYYIIVDFLSFSVGYSGCGAPKVLGSWDQRIHVHFGRCEASRGSFNRRFQWVFQFVRDGVSRVNRCCVISARLFPSLCFLISCPPLSSLCFAAGILADLVGVNILLFSLGGGIIFNDTYG